VHHDEEPDEGQESELRVKKMGDHSVVPSRA
jgi:hypothetical protein